MNKKQIISAFLKEKQNVRFAYLFGSRVKGYETETSDWDLAVYLDCSDDSDRWPVFQLEAELSREIGENVQVYGSQPDGYSPSGVWNSAGWRRDSVQRRE